MRKLSEKQKRKLKRHAELSFRRKLRRKGKYRPWWNRQKTEKIDLPENLSLQENYEETIGFFQSLRRAADDRNVRLMINFTTLQQIGPAAALVLAAELDCWRQSAEFPIRIRDVSRWNQDILRLLDQMGLFDLVKVANRPSLPEVSQSSVYFIRFKSSDLADGRFAQELRADLEEVIQGVPDWKRLYRGLTEAMTNVKHHAYPKERAQISHPENRRWWMFGAYDAQRCLLTCVLYDRGVGIPATLPLKHPMEHINSILAKLGVRESTDAALIVAATELGRTRTSRLYRGRGFGLADIKRLVTESSHGKLRIMSGSGRYVFEGEDPGERSSLPSPIGGTLIEWEVRT